MREKIADIVSRAFNAGAGVAAGYDGYGSRQDEIDKATAGVLALLPQWKEIESGDMAVVPREPTYALIRALSESMAVDEEGPFASLCDLLDFSGENKTHTVLRAAYTAMIAALPSPPEEG